MVALRIAPLFPGMPPSLQLVRNNAVGWRVLLLSLLFFLFLFGKICNAVFLSILALLHRYQGIQQFRIPLSVHTCVNAALLLGRCIKLAKAQGNNYSLPIARNVFRNGWTGQSRSEKRLTATDNLDKGRPARSNTHHK